MQLAHWRCMGVVSNCPFLFLAHGQVVFVLIDGPVTLTHCSFFFFTECWTPTALTLNTNWLKSFS
jgi:hypothetical protein